MPLQFIIFSHDDLIFRSGLDAVNEFSLKEDELNYCEENKLSLNQKTLLARMFGVEDRDLPETMDDGTKYWNLIYTIPKEINILN